jgi:hypothetical protein
LEEDASLDLFHKPFTVLIGKNGSRRLKQKYNQPGNHVHIWTLDKRVKAHEPDPESDPLS